MFILCYLSYGSIHVYREFWASSKVIIEDSPDKYHSSKNTLSNVDTVNFMVYGLTQFISGAMGDEFNLRVVMPLSYLGSALCFGLIAMTGFIGGNATPAELYIWFTILGLAQSICFPAYVSIVANWFSKKYRGTAVTGFCTCVNVGNILGVQIASLIMRATGDNWSLLFVILAC